MNSLINTLSQRNQFSCNTLVNYWFHCLTVIFSDLENHLCLCKSVFTCSTYFLFIHLYLHKGVTYTH